MEHWTKGLPSLSARLAADEGQLSQPDELGPDSPDGVCESQSASRFDCFGPFIDDVSRKRKIQDCVEPEDEKAKTSLAKQQQSKRDNTKPPGPKKVKTKHQEIQTNLVPGDLADQTHPDPVPGDLADQIRPLMQLGCGKCRKGHKGCLVCTRRFYLAVAKLISTEPFPQPVCSASGTDNTPCAEG